METRSSTVRALYAVLAAGTFMEFVGHGALGIKGVASWTSYFAVAGISAEHARMLMPYVGCFDLTLAFSLMLPSRAAMLYMAAWGLFTALLRPLSGESAWEAVERAGNYGPVFALFLLGQPGGLRSWLGFRRRDSLPASRDLAVRRVLLGSTVLLLLGHGMLGLCVQKPLFAQHYASIGLQSPWVEPGVGALECMLALAVLLAPSRPLLLGVLAWKLASESLSPLAGAPVWVFIEHGGSYAAPLALALLLWGAPVALRRGAAGGLALGG